MTDLDWCPELWLACHDDDEHNSNLANEIWEENGLDIVETYGRDLVPFLSEQILSPGTDSRYAAC